ncbi:MAG TPA: hypothetical protein VF155_00885 [Candidatus Dormibacteraeota bacterium]
MTLGDRPARVCIRVALGVVVAGMLTGVGIVGSTKVAHAQTPPPINCNLVVANPHQAAKAPHTVRVVANWTCTAAVHSISMTLSLSENGTTQAHKSCSNTGMAALRCAVSAACVKGVAFGTATGTVVAPPGYQPPSFSGTAKSNSVFLTCT